MSLHQTTKARVETIQAATGCRNTIVEEYTVEALTKGDAAFGFTASYHNQFASMFVSTVARLASIEDAQDELREFFAPRFDVESEEWLKFLLPLNAPAITMLMLAYQNAGTWVTRDELRRRTERFEFGQTFAAHSNIADAFEDVPAMAAE